MRTVDGQIKNESNQNPMEHIKCANLYMTGTPTGR